MIDTHAIVEAIEQLVTEHEEELGVQAVYIETVPEGATCPALLIQAVGGVREDAALNLMRITEYLTMAIVVDTQATLDGRQQSLLRQKVMDLFRKGYLQVRSRALQVQVTPGGKDDLERLFVDVQVDYYDVRNDDEDLTQMMESLETRVSCRTE